jgi:hypothetical protein
MARTFGDPDARVTLAAELMRVSNTCLREPPSPTVIFYWSNLSYEKRPEFGSILSRDPRPHRPNHAARARDEVIE